MRHPISDCGVLNRLLGRICVLSLLVVQGIPAEGVNGQAQSAKKRSFELRRGKAAVQSYCLTCHSLTAITDVRLTAVEWDEILDDMVEMGMVIPADKRKIVYDYLVSEYKRMPLNSQSSRKKANQSVSRDTLGEEIHLVRESPNAIAAGQKIYQDFGCDNCHKLQGRGGAGMSGPELGNVGAILGQELIRKKLRNPRAFYAAGFKQKFDQNTMPLYELTEQELDRVARFLSEKKEAGWETPAATLPDGTRLNP